MASLQPSHIQVFPKVEDLKNVIVVWRLDSRDEIGQVADVLDFFKSMNLMAKCVVIEHGKSFKNTQAREEFSSFCDERGVIFVPKSQLKWYGFPKGEKIKELVSGDKVDMLICMCEEPDFTVEYLAAGIRSDFTVGMSMPQWCNFSLVLEKGKSAPDAVEYLTALFEYMRKMQQ